jgi:hypothetical protein
MYNNVTKLATHAFAHTMRGYDLDTKCNTPLSKVRLPLSPHVGHARVGWVHVFMHSTPLTLLSSFHVKGLTQKCYG